MDGLIVKARIGTHRLGQDEMVGPSNKYSETGGAFLLTEDGRERKDDDARLGSLCWHRGGGRLGLHLYHSHKSRKRETCNFR